MQSTRLIYLQQRQLQVPAYMTTFLIYEDKTLAAAALQPAGGRVSAAINESSQLNTLIIHGLNLAAVS